ncbi:hypothetical protein OG709_29955 [Streptomyces sp. NBC_01267]|uniref:hypothetical protein n=1 Tax=Streptomyces sp. NBC_01267 TaxID=2903805 RepID=UPI002E2F0D0A|nr:hypothetical protein [Streptomyces sp. NBC_01267]
MSALEHITTYILAHYADDNPAYVRRIMPQLEAEAQELYDVVARELAEKVRAHTAAGYPQVSAHMSYDYAAGWRHGRETAAREAEGQ